MGIRLFAEVLDHAPATLTHREAWVLAVLAEDANDLTRSCWPGVEDDPKTVRRMRIPARSSRYEVLKALREKGALEVVSAGHRGRRAVYRIPAFCRLVDLEKGPEVPDTTDELGPENPDANPPEGSGEPGRNSQVGSAKPGPNETAKGPENQDATQRKGPDSPANGSGKPGPLPLNPLKRKNTLPPDADPSLFEAFWSAYPRKIAKGNGRKAWDAALKRKADPEAIVTAARAHAAAWQRSGTEMRWIPHPSTWLNGERYDDTDLPAAPPTAPAQRPTWRDPSEQGIF